MFVLCAVAGLMVGLSLGWAVQVNGENCPLYAKLYIIFDQANKTASLDSVSLISKLVEYHYKMVFV